MEAGTESCLEGGGGLEGAVETMTSLGREELGRGSWGVVLAAVEWGGGGGGGWRWDSWLDRVVAVAVAVLTERA